MKVSPSAAADARQVPDGGPPFAPAGGDLPTVPDVEATGTVARGRTFEPGQPVVMMMGGMRVRSRRIAGHARALAPWLGPKRTPRSSTALGYTCGGSSTGCSGYHTCAKNGSRRARAG